LYSLSNYSLLYPLFIEGVSKGQKEGSGGGGGGCTHLSLYAIFVTVIFVKFI
jgi:hypothetical protein